MAESEAQPPSDYGIDAVPPADASGSKPPEPPDNAPLSAEIAPSPQYKRDTSTCRPDQTPSWKICLEVLASLCGIALVVITFYYARAAYRQAVASETAANAARDAVCVAGRTLNETIRSNQAQETANKLAAKTTTDNFHLDQRAWLGASDYTYTITESGPITSTAIVLNTGKSPARDILCRITGVTKLKTDVLQDSDIVYPPDLPILKQGTIFPNQHFPLTAGGPPMESEKQKVWFENVQSGKWTQYFFGKVRYKDTFGRDHWTHFCTQFVPATKSGTPCRIYNTTDDEKPQKN